MKTLFWTGAALLATTAIASAGGIERSAQSVGIIFEDGKYAEFSFSLGNPAVSGIDPTMQETGDMAPSYTNFGAGFKMDVNDKIGVALIFDQPYGALADYPEGFYAGSTAELQSSAITLVASYDVSDRFVVFGGASYQTMSAVAELPFVANYTVESSTEGGIGYLAGAAFQIPDIALRVALTYRSEITTTHDTLEFGAITDTATITTPQSLNLEFQTGVNQKTLVFGSVRWVNWDGFDITPANFPGGSLIDYTDDRVTYNLGVGRKLSDTLSGAVTIGYEHNLGGEPSVLGPTDGFFSVGAGLTYTMDNVEITAGGKYIWIGDSVGPNGTFENNDGLGFGIKVAIAM